MNEHLLRIDEAIAALERGLREIPEFGVWLDLKATKAKWESLLQRTPGSLKEQAGAEAGGRRRPRKKALQIAISILRGTKEPISSAKIYEELEKMGVSLGGQNPISNLSAMLSKDKEQFQSHGKLGWTLKKEAEPSKSEALERGRLD